MQWLHLLVLAFFMASAMGQEKEDQTIIQTSETEENSSKQLPSPKVTESDSSPARQRPQQGPGWGGLISGLLGTITKTADVSDCPGKCLHALASLLCEEVKEDIACPSNSMRCCVDRKHLKRPNTAIDETSNLETTTNYRVRPVPARTTIATTTTTRTTTTTSRPAAVASDKQDKFGDYDYTDTTSDNSSASTTSKTASSVFFAAVLCMTFYFL